MKYVISLFSFAAVVGFQSSYADLGDIAASLVLAKWTG
jgi:hypothetical protein